MKHFRTAKYTDERFSLVNEKINDMIKTRIAVDSSVKYQKILGFGGAFTEASAYNLSRISKEKQEEALKLYFDPVVGLGYNLGRVSIHSCDFSLGSYSYVDDYDESLDSFSIDRDKWLVIPFIKDAMKLINDELLILASPWTPVWWMKDNKSFIKGGMLLDEYKQVWARYYPKFISAYEQEGIPIWGISVQNEPLATQRWDSCIYTKEAERDFVRDHLGPAMHEAGYQDKKILIWDHNRDCLYQRAKTVYDDPQANKYVWGAAFHWYVSEDFEQVGKTHQHYPDKHLLFTEGCQEGGPHFNSWETGERYGRNMIGDFNNYTEGYIDWNLFLDETGGPNHVNNLCDAPVMIKIWHEEIVKQSSYYYIGHFSKFVKRGAYRISHYHEDKKLMVTSFINPDQSKILIIQNPTEEDIPSLIDVDGEEAFVLISKRSISTFIF